MAVPRPASTRAAAEAPMTVVDIHAHLHPPDSLSALAPIIGDRRPASFVGRDDSDEPASLLRRLEMMDEAGVAIQVLSPMAGLAPYSADRAVATRAAALVNDAYATLVSERPDRFRAFA